jgi:hypothetical protein
MKIFDLLENMDILTELVQSNKIDEAIEGLDSRIKQKLGNKISMRFVIDLRDYLVTMILSESTSNQSLPYWLEFAKRISQYNFSSLILSLLLRNSPYNQLPINDRVKYSFIHLLNNLDNKLDVIKEMSETKFGNELLEISMETLVENDVVTIDLLQELRLFFLETYNKKLFEQASSELEEITDNTSNIVPSDIEDKINRLARCPTNLAQKLQPIMYQLKHGFGHISSNEYTAAKFVLASIKADKSTKYDFSPTLLNKKDWLIYLESVMTLKPPSQESFLIMGSHWTAGRINAQVDGTFKIFLSDSMGIGGFSFNDMIHSKEAHSIIKNRQVVFYYPIEVRQNSDKGCSIYALDDVRHFHTMEEYMHGQTLFSYLESTEGKIEKKITDNIQLKFCHLPDSLLRTQQSSKLLNSLHDEVVNKQGEKAIDSARKGFFINPDNQKLQNLRLNHKLQKMTERLERHISKILQSDDPNKSFDEFCEMADEHSFKKFKVRTEARAGITQQKLAENVRSPMRDEFLNGGDSMKRTITNSYKNMLKQNKPYEMDEEESNNTPEP